MSGPDSIVHSAPGRARGLWVPVAEVEAHLLFGWRIVDIGVAPHDDVLLAPPAQAEAAA